MFKKEKQPVCRRFTGLRSKPQNSHKKSVAASIGVSLAMIIGASAVKNRGSK